MKKTIVLALLALLGMTQAAAQDYEYVPFVREGVKWVYYTESNTNGGTTRYHALELKGDTVLGGKTYKVMRKYSGSVIFHDDGIVPVCLREEGRVVYGIVPGGRTYADCPVGIEGDTLMLQAITSGQEFVLYDFNEPIDFLTARSRTLSFFKRVVIPDKIAVAGHKANRYTSHSLFDFCMIEGIGYDGYQYSYPLAIMKTDTPEYFYLSHVIENGKIIYRSEHYKMRSTLESTMPIMQEGVKWVNERVVVSGGVTTRTRYTYEFKGKNSLGYAVCYCYEGEELDENATFAAYLLEPGAPVTISSNPDVTSIQGKFIQDSRFITTIHNEPLERVVEEGRNMINSPSNPGNFPIELYSFGGDYSDIGHRGSQNFFIRAQNESFLSRENFVEVEPVIIGEDCCRRFAYLGEDGQPLAYVIEGIGFDSRDLGDLLTPFTSKPDPDADYQEWCGLSHVIKDGQIIYKGMCYREQMLDNDVNNDGRVSIDDVTALINVLLTDEGLTPACDINHDNRVNIADVTDLINILLTQ